eukprot:COSAG01_NODE_12562_length_1719_cov_1.431481_1_plen_141_part_00
MPPYTPVEWVGQEERSFAGGETRLVVTFQVLDGQVVSTDPRYAGVVRTCMIMCEMPQEESVAVEAEAPGYGAALGYGAAARRAGPPAMSRSRSPVGMRYEVVRAEEGVPPEPEPEPEQASEPEPELIAWFSRKNLQAYRE